MNDLPGVGDFLTAPETYWRSQGLRFIAGVDEVGRGPLAGPVVAAAVILPAGTALPGLRDSKRLSAAQREDLDTQIRALALALSIREQSARQIERYGILAASLKAMVFAVRDLTPSPEMILIDGHLPLPLAAPQQPVIKGDDLCPSISAASVVAKVYRDRLMTACHHRYPQYNFAQHKGYGTAEHLEALRTWGPCPLHRRTFRGVKEWITE
jgi:ribonuclease HII